VLQSAGGLVLTNVFQHVAVTYDKTSGIGRLTSTVQSCRSLHWAHSHRKQAQTCLSVTWPDTVPFGPIPFLGLIDELSIYSRALTPNELNSIYLVGAAGKCSSMPVQCAPAPSALVSWWRGESNSLDSVSGNNGVFSGAAFGRGEVGTAFNFGPSGNNVRVPASASLDVGNASGPHN